MEKDPFINLYEDLMEMKHRRAGTKIFQKGLEKMQEDVMRAGEEIDRFVRQTVREFDSDFGRDPAFDRKYFLMRLKWISRSRHLSSPSFFLSASRHRNGRPKGGSDEPAEGSHRPSGGGAFGQHLDRSVLWYNSFRKR